MCAIGLLVLGSIGRSVQLRDVRARANSRFIEAGMHAPENLVFGCSIQQMIEIRRNHPGKRSRVLSCPTFAALHNLRPHAARIGIPT